MVINVKTTGSNVTQTKGTQASRCKNAMAVGQRVDETRDCCDGFVDIGNIVEANDTVLEVHFNGLTSQVGAARLQLKAEHKYKNVSASMKVMDDGVILSLNFEYTVEKLIFQLEENL
jgi:uncharacterized protein YfcZ (UPF0381/DUF406 family)